jgi:signal transduction histidine kinase
MGEVVRRAIDRSERLIDQLLLLARADEPITRTDSVDLAEAAARALAEQAGVVSERSLRIDSELHSAVVAGDRVLLEQMVANVIDNSTRHNRDGGHVSIAVEQQGSEALLRVTNDGEVIPADGTERLFGRFARLDDSRARATGGYGIGLSLVRTIAEGHDGTATARARADGGLEVEVRLPAVVRAADSVAGQSPAFEEPTEPEGAGATSPEASAPRGQDTPAQA